MSKYTTMTMDLLRENGFHCGKDTIVERSVPAHKGAPFGRKFDFLGIGDFIALKKGIVMLVQSTNGPGKAEHFKTIKEHWMELVKWEDAGGIFRLITWTKKLAVDKAGAKRRMYVPQVYLVAEIVDDFELIKVEL